MSLLRENPVLALFTCLALGLKIGHHLQRIFADYRAEWDASRAS
ncbi:hypothetical protein ACIQOV_36830 [Kitasatospora sp. NPDC091257]